MSFSALGQAIFDAFSTDDTLKALVDTRIFPRTSIPETPDKPYLSYARVSGTRDAANDGALADHAGVRIQIDIISDTLSAADACADAIRKICSRGGPSVAGVTSSFGSGLRRLALIGGPRDLPQYEPGMGQATPFLTLDLMATHVES